MSAEETDPALRTAKCPMCRAPLQEQLDETTGRLRAAVSVRLIKVVATAVARQDQEQVGRPNLSRPYVLRTAC
eukprot:SAG31_NODE_4250_length_3419_cov_24.125904_2_plen_73_part_00